MLPLGIWWLVSIATFSAIVCYYDIRYRKIPNRLVSVIALVGIGFVLMEAKYSHLIHAVAILIVGAGLFKFRVLAAGDSKLLAALSLMILPKYLLLTILTTTFLGGLLAISQWALSHAFHRPQGIYVGVPYGVPICIASLLGIAVSL